MTLNPPNEPVAAFKDFYGDAIYPGEFVALFGSYRFSERNVDRGIEDWFQRLSRAEAEEEFQRYFEDVELDCCTYEELLTRYFALKKTEVRFVEATTYHRLSD